MAQGLDKDQAPPPPYTDLSDQPYAVNSSSPAPSQHQGPSSSGVAPTLYGGPTFAATIYPSINNPFAPEALAEADQRARRRFFTSLLLAVLLWILLGILAGGGMGAEMAHRPKHHMHGGS